MANSSINLVNLDFDSVRSSLKTYLQAQPVFTDYDFEGSNISVLLDLLAHNTFLNAFYLNMIGSESFLDSAQLKDSVVSHAKELNYLPRSFSSAEAEISLSVNTGNTSLSTLTLPKGTTFTTKVGSNTYTFSTQDNVIMGGQDGIFTANSLLIYEGQYFSDLFTYNESNTSQRFIISNPTVDMSSLTVTVIEDSGSSVLSYSAASSLFGLTDTSKVYFRQMAQNEKYEIIFGDGVIGRKPKDNSTILVEYRVTNGELPNGAFKFTIDGSVSGYTNTSIRTISAASSGAVSEDINSIKFNAPRHFTTQERAVTAEDYENLLRAAYPEINAVSAYGGEEANPPQYGKVFISVDLNNFDGLPQSKEIVYKKFIKERSSLSIDPVFISPEYLYIHLESTVKYNINLTTLNPEDIKTAVISSILDFKDTYLDDFKTTLRYSQLLRAIDDSHSSIVSNDTEVFGMKIIIPPIGQETNVDVDFKIPLIDTFNAAALSHTKNKIHTITSSQFIYRDQYVNIEDDGAGILRLMAPQGSTTSIVKNVGTVNYDTGLVQISGLKVDKYFGSGIKIYARPRSRDISSTKNTILTINQTDVDITIEQVRE